MYFPATIAAVVVVARARASRAIVLAGTVLPTVALLLLAAPWWAWHGVDGWGPRLLIPGVPLLAVSAAIGMERWRRPMWAALIGVCLIANLPPLFQHPTPVVRYVWASSWPAVDRETAARVPPFALRQVDRKMVMIPDAGHMLHHDQPAAVAAAMEQFLA